METWRNVWREGIVPLLPLKGLKTLLKALQTDDPKLLQGLTTSTPKPNRPVEAACVIGFCGWRGAGLKTVTKVENFFKRVCKKANQLLGEPNKTNEFIGWHDTTPRAEMIQELLPEVKRAIAQKGEK